MPTTMVVGDEIIRLTDRQYRKFLELKRERFGDVYDWDLSRKAFSDTAREAKRHA